MAKIKVAIAGINGRMGRASINALLAYDDFEVVGAFGRANADYRLRQGSQLFSYQQE